MLVDKAGSTMNEVVTSIRRVTDIVGEISAASSEQSQGVAQVGEAVTQMDQTTQQNAALVEESAAAADSLRKQAQDLVDAVAVFKLDSRAQPMPAARKSEPLMRSVPQPNRGSPEMSVRSAAATAEKTARKPVAPARAVTKPVQSARHDEAAQEDQWESF